VELSPVADATLYEFRTTILADGAGEGLFAGKTSALRELRRAVVRFDVASALPRGAAVDSVVLRMECTRASLGPPRTVQLHRLEADWSEGPSIAAGEGGQGAPAAAGDATWVHRRYPADVWQVPGGDFVSAPSASVTVAGLGTFEWGPTLRLVADVQAWVDDPSTQHGWIVRGEEVEEKSTRRFGSRESATSPRLRVVFTSPGGE
jgi:hypothetical protein